MSEHKLPLRYGSSSTEILVTRASDGAYTVGDGATMRVVVDDALVRTYADQYGDRNPIHLDDEAGRKSLFRSRVAHGMLSFNFFSTILGAGFPGPGSIFLGVQDWKFTAPVKIGDALTLRVAVAELAEKGRMVVEASAVNEAGVSVMGGRLSLIAPRL